MASLGTCLQHLVTLIDWSESGNLFPDDKHSPAELLARAQNINQYCFYGRCLGFQVNIFFTYLSIKSYGTFTF